MHTFIIGNSGSGKSTLARRLASQHALQHVDLDEFAWTKTVGKRRHIDDSLAELQATVKSRPSVIEGMYADLVERLIKPADQLIWIDLPVQMCIKHCKVRPFEPHKWPTAEDQHAFLPTLLEFVALYPERVDALGAMAHARLCAAHAGKVLHLRSLEECNSFTRPED